MKEKVIILSSGRCGWGKCIFCGYGRVSSEVLSAEELKGQIDNLLADAEGVDFLKVYISGSFLDEKQVPREVRKYLVGKCRELGIKRLLIESRPEFITDEALKDFEGVDLTIAIGLEVADDDVLGRIRKGFGLKDYEKAVKVVKKNGFKVRTYILANPPYVGDPQEVLDRSVEYALKFSDEVVIINCYPHKDTPLYELYLKGEWRPLGKGEFFDMVKKWLDDPRVSYDVSQHGVLESWFSWIPRFKDKRPIKGVGEEYLVNPVYERWQRFLVERYVPPERDVVLFVPCSYRKPYRKSRLHRGIRRILKELGVENRVHLVVISSPGVIPEEFDRYYPFNSYDWQPWKETPEIKRRYIEVTRERVKKYLEKHRERYEKVLCYFNYDAESYIALKEACEEVGIELK
ncbi:MAG: hypothetical protein DRP11_02290, partial [Candidatus Aenigmatarchaeota archaeon]